MKHYSILLVCTLAILFFLIHGYWTSGISWEWFDFVIAAFVALIAVAPVVCIHFFINRLKLSVPRFVFYFCSIIIIFASCYIYYNVEFNDADDAYRGLFYVFLPPVQIILLGGIFLFCKTLEAIITKNNRNGVV